MIIKLRKQKMAFTLGVFLLIILLFFSVDGRVLMKGKADIEQFLATIDSGLSHRVSVVDEGEGIYLVENPEGWSEFSRKKYRSFLYALPNIIKHNFQADLFERMDIDIPYMGLKEILLDRERAISRGYNQNSSFVKAEIKFRTKNYQARIRLKGDWSNHWLSQYRMSFRVELKEDGTVMGFKRFSLQKPLTRSFPYDYSFQSLLAGVNNISIPYRFTHVYVNGRNWGIMALEEHMSKEFLEKQRRKDSLIVRFSDERNRFTQQPLKDPYALYKLSDPSLVINPYDGRRHLKDDYQRKVFSYLSDKHRNFSQDLYDIDSFSKAYILSTLWGSWHPLWDLNSRYYFNPYTLQLESISTDQTGYSPLESRDSVRFSCLPEQYLKVLSSSSYHERLYRNLDLVSREVSKVQLYFDEASKFFPVDKKKNTSIVIDNMDKLLSNREEFLFFNPSFHSGCSAEASSEINIPTYEQASSFTQHLHIKHYTSGKLELYNLLPDEVLVKEILFEGKPVKSTDIIVPSYLKRDLPVILETDYVGIRDKQLSVLSIYQGFERTATNEYSLFSKDIKNPLLEVNYKYKCPQYCEIKKGTYFFKKGKWNINSPIILKGNVEIPAGTHLIFNKDSYLIVQGKLIVSGTLDDPVIFESTEGFWKGLYVWNAEERSYLSNLKIKNLNALEDDLLRLTGGINFYKADVDIENVLIENVKAEDAINIVQSDYKIDSLTIKNTSSDALDSDFSNGTIENSSFTDIAGDALDFSGSTSDISNVSILRAGDKGISVGEESFVNIENTFIENTSIGVTSKDASEVVMLNTIVKDFTSYGIMSFTKKDFYSKPSSVKMINCNVDAPFSYLRQKGTFMTVDGQEIEQEDFNVDKFYKSFESSL